MTAGTHEAIRASNRTRLTSSATTPGESRARLFPSPRPLASSGCPVQARVVRADPEYQLPYTRASQKLGHVVLFGKPVTVMRT